MYESGNGNVDGQINGQKVISIEVIIITDKQSNRHTYSQNHFGGGNMNIESRLKNFWTEQKQKHTHYQILTAC